MLYYIDIIQKNKLIKKRIKVINEYRCKSKKVLNKTIYNSHSILLCELYIKVNLTTKHFEFYILLFDLSMILIDFSKIFL